MGRKASRSCGIPPNSGPRVVGRRAPPLQVSKLSRGTWHAPNEVDSRAVQLEYLVVADGPERRPLPSQLVSLLRRSLASLGLRPRLEAHRASAVRGKSRSVGPSRYWHWWGLGLGEFFTLLPQTRADSF